VSHISKIFFSNVGANVAYLPPQIHVILPDDRPDMAPFTTVLLPNGGGKTTMIALVLAIFEPNMDRFLAKLRKDQAAERTFGSYLSEKGDVSIVACEMIVPTGLTLEKRLVCGYCARNSSAHSTPVRDFFVFESTNPAVDLMAMMPGTGGSEPEIRGSSDFHLWSDRMRDRKVSFETVNRQKDWRPLLVSRKVDVDMLRLLVQANLTESDPTVGILTSRKESDFVASILGKVMNAEEMEAKHRTFLDASIKIQDREGKAQLLERHKGLGEKVGRFDEEAALTRQARTEVDSARERVRDLADGIAATALSIGGDVGRLDAEMQDERAAIAAATRAAEAAEAAKGAAEHRVLSMELGDVEGRHRASGDALEANRRERAAIELASLYRTVTGTKAEIAAVEATLSKREAEVAPFQEAADNALRVLLASLRNALEGAEERLRLVGESVAVHEADRAALKKAKHEAAVRRRSLDNETVRIEGDLRSAARDRAKLQDKGTILADETTDGALRRVEGALTNASQRVAEIDAETSRARDENGRFSQERARLDGDRKAFVLKQVTSNARVDEAVALRAVIDQDRIALRILEADTIDPDSDEALGLLERVSKTRMAEHVAREQEIAAHGRAIESIDRWDVAVPNPDAEAALRDLRAGGLEDAIPFGRWLADKASPESALRIVQGDPGRLAGIHVPDEKALSLAGNILRRRVDSGMLSPLVVSIGDGIVPDPLPGRRTVVMPTTSAAWSRDEAALARNRQSADKAAREEDSMRCLRESETLGATCERIRNWRARYGAGLHAENVAARDAATERLAEIDEGILLAEQARGSLQDRIGRLQEDKAAATAERARLASAMQDLKVLVATEKAAAPLRERLVVARDEAVEARKTEERAGKAEDRSNVTIGEAKVRQAAAKAERTSLVAEIAKLGEAPEGADRIAVIQPEKAREGYQTARENLRRNSELAFGETQFRRDSLRETLATAEGKAATVAERPGMDLPLAATLAEGTLDLAARDEDLRRLDIDLELEREGTAEELGGARNALRTFEQRSPHRAAAGADTVGTVDEARASRSEREVLFLRAGDALAFLTSAHQQRSQEYDRLVRQCAIATDLAETVASDHGLHGVTPDPTRAKALPAGEVEGLRTGYGQAKRAFGDARAAAEKSDQRCKDAFEEVRRYASHEQFQRMEPTMSRHILSADYDAAFEDSGNFLRMTLDRIACLKDDLDNLDKAVDTAVSIMAPFVSDAMRVLKMATEFRIPDTSPVLPGMQVMQCRQAIFSVTESARRQDIAGQLIKMAHARSVPQDGPALLAALCDSIAGGKIGIRILKINTIDNGEHQPYEAMMHSGGQYMAAGMMTFALISSLRARTAGNLRSNRAATLIMDNPFGKLSYDEFWRTVLSVMKVLGVQIIAYTGKPDLVTRQFPGTVMLQRNRNAANTFVAITPKHVVWEQEAA
jgi:hypothetical protein